MGTEEHGGSAGRGAVIGLLVGGLPGVVLLALMYAHECRHLGDGTGRWALQLAAPYLFLVLVALPALLGALIGAVMGRSSSEHPAPGKPGGKGDGPGE